MKKFRSSFLIDLSWTSLTKNVESQPLKDLLKVIVLRKWVSICTCSFLKAWVQIINRKVEKTGNNLSEKAEPAHSGVFMVKS